MPSTLAYSWDYARGRERRGGVGEQGRGESRGNTGFEWITRFLDDFKDPCSSELRNMIYMRIEGEKKAICGPERPQGQV